MPVAKKPGSKSKACGPKSKACKGPCLTDNFLSDFTSHKTTVMTLMVGMLAIGVMFAMMLGVSAAQF